MKTSAAQLTWHDASIDSTEYDQSARRLVCQVEVFRWDIEEDCDAEPGLLIFEGVQRIKGLHDLAGEVVPKPPSALGWGVLAAFFERDGTDMQCRFLLELSHLRNELGGHGYGELIITCQDAWYIPGHEKSGHA